MKVFWSWQSDTPGKTGRHFVRDCLLVAIDRLNAERSEVSELEAAAREPIELDQDRKGVKGSPGLADTIYAKIREAAVVVCDVTPVAELVAGDGRVKKLTNPNVAIELGYAQGTRGDDRVLMVLNLVRGRHEELAFDLRHKTGILTYSLVDDASKEVITAEAKRFTALLVDALRPYAEEPAAPVEPPAPFVRTPSTTDQARWWQPGEVIGQTPGRAGVVGPADPLVYLRLMPAHGVPEIAIADLRDHARHFSTFDGGFNQDRNGRGMILLAHTGGTAGEPIEVQSATQLFETGEVWAFDAHALRRGRMGDAAGPLVPILPVERNTHRLLFECARSMVEYFGTSLPISVEFGMAPANEFVLPTGAGYSGICYRPVIQIHDVLVDCEDPTIEACARRIFSRFWDAFGERRPVDMPLGRYR